MPNDLTCRACGSAFARPRPAGRLPYYCSSLCVNRVKREGTRRRLDAEAVAAALAVVLAGDAPG